MYAGVEAFPKPVIAVINGSCYGGGNGLAMACDIRIAADPSITFTLSEVKIGFSPAIISKWVLRSVEKVAERDSPGTLCESEFCPEPGGKLKLFRWGVGLARSAMLTAQPVTAQQLLGINALQHIAQNLEEAHAKAAEYVQQIVGGAPGAQADVKKLVAASAMENERDAEKVIRGVFEEMLRPSEEGKYGLQCFQAKKKPDWSTLRR
jgi:hydroxymethylglutaryl-CoA lyase